MIRLAPPQHTLADVLRECDQGIQRGSLCGKISASQPTLQACCQPYASKAQAEDLYTVLPSFNSVNNSVKIAQLTKKDLVDLYEQHFAARDKPARCIYDTLLIKANDKCPYCGGIGRPSTLDHYLPKSHYPEFSILPENLVPSCRDCNSGAKSNMIADTKGSQVLHPYFDVTPYCEEQWIYAAYNNDSIRYYVNPPQNWNKYQKERVQKHFDVFNLGLKFSIVAAERFSTYRAQIYNLNNKIENFQESKETILQPVIRTYDNVNHWDRVMCVALLDPAIVF